LLAVSTSIGALGLAAGGSAGALLAKEMTGSTAWSGVPLGALVLGSAAGALLIVQRTARAGRFAGLMLGCGIGAAGAGMVVAAAVLDHFGLLLVGSAALGAGNAAVFLARYAAADLGAETERGRALGTVLFATALGAVASPNLLGPSGDVAEALALPRISGLYLVALLAFLGSCALLAFFGHSHASGGGGDIARSDARSGVRSARLPLFILAASNLLMVAVMTIAPVHLAEHGHSLNVVGLVISIHVLCMFAPSPLTGRLTDRVGGTAVAAAGAVLLAAAALTGALVDLSSGVAMTGILALLGLGWNAGVVGGSTLLHASVPAPLRPHTEGIGEIAMGLAAGAGAPIAGLIVAFGDFKTLLIAAAAAGALMFAFLRINSSPFIRSKVRPTLDGRST
jgi:MFS family permease